MMIVNRRTALALTAGLAATAFARPHIARAAAPFEQPPLPYAEDALAPQISARTVALHYGKHHKGYFDKLNEIVAGEPYAEMTLEEVVAASKKDGDDQIFNQAGQAWNHIQYWEQFKDGPAAPEGAFADAVERDFGGIEGLKTAIGEAAGKVFGTGWVWLTVDGGKLVVEGMQDAGNPLAAGRPALLGIDVWEHAYYLDYENRKAEHVKAVLDGRVNWRFAGEKMRA